MPNTPKRKSATETSIDGLFFNGILDLTDYTDEVDSTGLVTRLGYEGPDGVVFNNYTSSIAEASAARPCCRRRR